MSLEEWVPVTLQFKLHNKKLKEIGHTDKLGFINRHTYKVVGAIPGSFGKKGAVTMRVIYPDGQPGLGGQWITVRS